MQYVNVNVGEMMPRIKKNNKKKEHIIYLWHCISAGFRSLFHQIKLQSNWISLVYCAFFLYPLNWPFYIVCDVKCFFSICQMPFLLLHFTWKVWYVKSSVFIILIKMPMYCMPFKCMRCAQMYVCLCVACEHRQHKQIYSFILIASHE